MFGLLISTLICVNAAKMIRDAVAALLNIVPKGKRNAVQTLLSESGLFAELPALRYDVDEENNVTAVAALSKGTKADALLREGCERLAEQCLDQTGIKLRFVLYV